MSMSQFNKWLKTHGVTKGPRCYMAPCQCEVTGSDDGEHRLRVTMTTSARDRHGDILEPGGAQVADFLKNPVVLWAHEYRELPIGRVTALVREGAALKAEMLFAPTPFAQEVYGLYARGFLRAWSVGFLPLEWKLLEDEEGRVSGYHIRSWELIELSAVPVPANREALTDALTKGLVREPKLMEMLSRTCGEAASEAEARPAWTGRRRPDADGAPEFSQAALATMLAPKLMVRLRGCLGDSVSREIRRMQGRLE